ncbi:MAG: glycosyltransferase family 9 protein, partial [Verrucomicrobiota bacterium]
MISSARSALIQNLETCASRSSGRMKLLTVQFRSLGDAALSLAAIGAIRRRFPDCELHSLVPDVAAPLLENHPDVNRVWAFPRNRGKANLVQSWSVLRALRAERFDLSIDLVGNDRGALISLIC